jgi:Histidine kinase-, DNA gyrase B-, and HSP90-like ATPase
MENASESLAIESQESAILDWSPDAPRGGKTVINRAMKDGTTVPLFLAQTLISSLRDVGYNDTTSALCEHVDNAIQAGATEIRVYFNQPNKKGANKGRIDVAVYDNGNGMSPSVLKVATSFGGSMTFDKRSGIGRFGMGMKTAALSMSPVLEIYSWQEVGGYYSMTLDVEAIGNSRSNMVELPEADFHAEIPEELADILIRPMAYPTSLDEQQLLATKAQDLPEALGRSGSIVFMPSCDRLTYAKSKTLTDHATAEMSRVYRRFIGKGVRILVNNRPLEAFDPTYFMPDARHVRLLDPGVKTTSNLLLVKDVKIGITDADDSETADAVVKIFRLPIEEWTNLQRTQLKNQLKVFDGRTVTILRNDREVASKAMPELTTRHTVTHWYRVQIDFPGVLDEAFGVSSNKQGVRPKDRVIEALKREIGSEITSLNEELKHLQGKMATERKAAKISESEKRASDVDYQHAKELDPKVNLSQQEIDQLDNNLRGLAIAIKRDGESDEQAFERVKASKYSIVFRHDKYWPFYHVDHKFGKVLVTINTAHPFYSHLYQPLSTFKASDDGEDGPKVGGDEDAGSPLVALELLLLSMARATSVLEAKDDQAAAVIENLRQEWSNTYRVNLTA